MGAVFLIEAEVLFFVSFLKINDLNGDDKL